MKNFNIRIYSINHEDRLVWSDTLEDSDASIGEISRHFYGFARMFLRREARSPYVEVTPVKL